ncbi:MAG: hypothetical protein BWK80_20405 [Desulfobacteraceae bacterium IS3]|nr:MAG: hypothetical protein BWK80_20405 [Desulfobacteraceae bacterium IS3]
MADFNVFFPHLLKHEGGFVDHPSDPGGATNKGVTMTTFRLFAQSLLGVEPTLNNLKNLTDEQAGKIYKKMYWDKIRGDEITLQELANIVFDFYVNAGGNGAKLLQRVLKDMGQNVSIDGVIGPATMKILDSLDQREVYQRYKNGRIAYYQALVRKNPKLKVFLKGWLNRVNTFPDMLGVEFGLIEIGEDAVSSLKDVSKKVIEMLSRAVDDLSSLEVMTYTSDNLEAAAYHPDTKTFSGGAGLRAYTRIESDGDMVNLIPERTQSIGEGGETLTGAAIDEQLWRIHRVMVAQAQTNRAAFLKALSEAAGTLFGILEK